jgi:cytochrome c oxidase subunit 2
VQSLLNPHGTAAAEIASLAWLLFVGGGAILALIVALTLQAVFAPRRWLAKAWFVVAGGVVFPVAVLSVLLVYTARSMRAIDHADAQTPGLEIEVTAHQWWWRVRYLGSDRRLDFETANEIRIPAGVPVRIHLRSADVIHSFWVPNLAGKVDMVPGRTNRIRLEAANPGTFRGQCAEYCGGPHARMALYVIAEEGARFEAWRLAQRAPAAPTNEVFATRCAACHAIRGTGASGQLGPDLTHVASRLSLGAGSLPNDVATLSAWIASSQHVKPGNLMPSFEDLPALELQSVATYLSGLR